MNLGLLRTEITNIHNGNILRGNFSSRDRGWILLDSNDQGTPHWHEADFWTWKVIFSSSPKLTRYKEWAKQAAAVKYVMKPWSWPEICAAAPLQSFRSGRQPTTTELWDAYSRFGPSARTVYRFCMNPAEHENVIVHAVAQCRDLSTLFPQGDFDWDDSVSDALVVVGPATWDGNIDRRILSGNVATPFIMDIVHQRAQHLLGLSMRKMYNNLLSRRLSRGTAGLIFEDAAHRILGGVRTHIYLPRSLPSGQVSSSQIQCDLSMTSQAIVFRNITQISGNLVPRKYYRLLHSNSTGIDSLALVDGTPILFQFTTSLDSPVKVEGLQSVAKILPAAERYSKKWRLIFVVPTDIEPEFKHQPYQPLSSETVWENRVEQCVLKLFADHLFPTVRT